jgi:hypothetical protein
LDFAATRPSNSIRHFSNLLKESLMNNPLSRRDFGLVISKMTVGTAMTNVILLDSALAQGGSSDLAAGAAEPELAVKRLRLGAHSLPHYDSSFGVPDFPLSTPPMNTRVRGSTMLLGVGRGYFPAFAQDGSPTDNFGNSYTQIGESHRYGLWRDSGTALYACQEMTGGTEQVISTSRTFLDEVTMSAIEVIGGMAIVDTQWNEVLLDSQRPISSLPVTTTGPAMLIAYWWGDGIAGPFTNSATPNNGFQLIDVFAGSTNTAYVQCCVAAKRVSKAGTYDVTWTSTPPQGAQLWLVAIQASATG